MAARHNEFIFRLEDEEVALIRDFEGMYRQCEDPHGQSRMLENLSYHLVTATLDRAVAMLGHEGRLAIADLGCGLGYFTRHLKQCYPEALVYGLDISSVALERAARRAPDCTFRRVDLKTADLCIDGGRRFDLAVALDCLYYFEDHEIHGVLANIRALLAPGGFLMVGYHLPEDMRFGLYLRSLTDAERLLIPHALEIVYSFEVHNRLDRTYSGAPVGRHLYFLARDSS